MSTLKPTRVRLPALGQNGTLVLRSDCKSIERVEIVPGWRDDATLDFLPGAGDSNPEIHTFGDGESSLSEQTIGRLQLKMNEEGIDTSLGRKGSLVEVDVLPTSDEDSVKIVATIPEKSNLTIQLVSGDIDVAGKVEGDAHLSTRGSITVSKLRGHNVALNAGGTVHVKKAVEARSVKIDSATRVRARMINGSDVAIDVNAGVPDRPESVKVDDDDDEGAAIDVGSLYVSGGVAESANDALLTVYDYHRGDGIKYNRGDDGELWGLVRVKSTHGHVTVNAKTSVELSQSAEGQPPLVDLGGVNGSCDVELELSNNVWEVGHADYIATRVHFDAMTPESISTITTRGRAGSSSITMDRKLGAEVRLLSVAGSGATLPEIVDAHLLTGDDLDGIQFMLTDLDANSKALKNGVDAGSAESGDFISIETDAFARDQGLAGLDEKLSPRIQYAQGIMSNRSGEPDSRFDVRSRGKINIDGAASQALHGFQGKKKESDASVASLPLLAVATDGKIKLETLSWFGSIARRYGMEEDDARGVGRQASRAPRLEK
ncbi:hypothetical protein ACHAXT_002717 [Thalassiosira profunda]